MNKIVKKDSEIISNNEEENKNDLIQVGEGLLFDTRTKIESLDTISVPITKLATLGSGVSSLLPAIKEVTNKASLNTNSSKGLYKIANLSPGDTLKMAKDKTSWGAIRTADGRSKMAKLQEVTSLTPGAVTTSAINPAMMMVAVALYSIEQRLDNIEKMQKRIIQLIEFEKESAVEADVEQLISIINKYKYNWDNDKFVSSNYKMVSDVQRTARAHMISYQKEINAILDEKKLLVVQTHVKEKLNNLLKQFKYYRLSLYTFSLSSLLEVMLGGNFKEGYISGIKEEVQKFSENYRDIFGKCSVYLEDISSSSLETNVLKGVGSLSGFIGKTIGSIPVVKKGSADEFFQDMGDSIKKNVHGKEQDIIGSFAEISNPETGVFIEKMSDMIRIYNKTSEIYFDKENIYLAEGNAN